MQLNKITKNIEQIEIVASNSSKTSDSLSNVIDKFALKRSFSVFNSVKRCGILVSDALLILILLPFWSKENIYALFKSGLTSEQIDGKKDVYYDLKNNEKINWRTLLYMIANRFKYLVSNEEQLQTAIKAIIFDDTTIQKAGVGIEKVSRVFDHVSKKYILGFKLLVCGFWDGSSFIPIDFSMHRERGTNIEKAERKIMKLVKIIKGLSQNINTLKKNKKQVQNEIKQKTKEYSKQPTKANSNQLDSKNKSLKRIIKQLSAKEKNLKTKKKGIEKLEEELSEMKLKSGIYGLSKDELENQHKKTRARNTSGYKRAKECDIKKTDSTICMLKSAVKKRFIPDYVLTDTWFFCYKLLKTIVEIGKGIHLISMAKIGTSKYILLENKKEYYPMELISRYERKIKYNRKLKAHYIKVAALYQDIRVNMYFVRLGRTKKWRLLVTTNLSLSFEKLIEIYKIRWTIEIFFKECKQYLQMGECSSRNLDAQIADVTLSMIRYILLSYYKRIHYNQTIGYLFKGLIDSVLEESIIGRLQNLFFTLIELFVESAGIDIIRFYEDLLRNPKSEFLLSKIGIENLKITFSKVA